LLSTIAELHEGMNEPGLIYRQRINLQATAAATRAQMGSSGQHQSATTTMWLQVHCMQRLQPMHTRSKHDSHAVARPVAGAQVLPSIPRWCHLNPIHHPQETHAHAYMTAICKNHLLAVALMPSMLCEHACHSQAMAYATYNAEPYQCCGRGPPASIVKPYPSNNQGMRQHAKRHLEQCWHLF